MRTGLGELELANPTSDPPTLPVHKIRTGDIVGLEEHASAKQGSGGKKATQVSQEGPLQISGVVFRVTETRVTIALSSDEEVPAEMQERCRIMNIALQQLQSQVKSGDTSTVTQPLMRVLFNLQKPEFQNPSSEVVFFDETLNESQRGAVLFALGAEETGKTYTLVEIVRQLVKDGKRVLVCGPSNISVGDGLSNRSALTLRYQLFTLDNLVERLSRHRLNLIRLGHPARILPAVVDYSLDMVTRTSDAGQIVTDIRRDMDRTLTAITKSKSRQERRALYGELKDLRKDFKVRERKVVEDVVRGSRVVMATLNGCGGKNMFKEEFDVVVVDEATQALEAECWIAILKGKKLIMAGDHLQLPPTVKYQTQIPSTTALSAPHALSPSHVTLSTTLFDRLLSFHGPRVKRMLTIQYRMHDAIMHFPSTELYDSQLVADPSVAKRLLCQMEGVRETEYTGVPVVFIDTAGCGMEEGKEEEMVGEGESKWNEGEVEIVVKHIEALVEAGVREGDVGVITPYAAQVGLLVKAVRERWPGVEIGS
ncbi:AAA domain-containing protein, partial [Endogone sp. FLAS-F59071]